MRTLVVLLGVLLLVPLAEAESTQETSVRVATEVTQNVVETMSPCLDEVQGLRQAPTEPVAGTESCRSIVPDCSFVFVTIHDDPFWLEPEPHPGCAFDWVSFVLRLLQP